MKTIYYVEDIIEKLTSKQSRKLLSEYGRSSDYYRYGTCMCVLDKLDKKYGIQNRFTKKKVLSFVNKAIPMLYTNKYILSWK